MKIKKILPLLFAIIITTSVSLRAAELVSPPAVVACAPVPTIVWTPELEAQVEMLFIQEYARLDALRQPWWARSRAKTLMAKN